MEAVQESEMGDRGRLLLVEGGGVKKQHSPFQQLPDSMSHAQEAAQSLY
jgi:hypothetical protein